MSLRLHAFMKIKLSSFSVQRVFTPGCGGGDGDRHTLTPTLTAHTQGHTNTGNGLAFNKFNFYKRTRKFDFPQTRNGVECPLEKEK